MRVAGLAIYLVLLLVAGKYCLTDFPNTGDEHSILFQAKVFSRLQAAAPAPPEPAAFESHWIEIRDGRWFTIYPPFYSLLLAPGVWLGHPLLIVALLSCAILALLHRYLKKEGEPDAMLIVALLAFSPTFFFHSISYYNHLGMLLGLTAALNLRGRPWLLGLALGLGFGVRTYSSALLALPFLGELLLTRQWCALPRALAGGLGGLFAVSLLNLAVSGHWADPHFLLNLGFRLHLDPPPEFSSSGRWLEMWSSGLRWTFGRGPWSLQNLKFPESGAMPWGFVLIVGGVLTSTLGQVRKPVLLLALAAALALGHFSFANSPSGRFGERYFFETHFIWIILAFTFVREIARHWRPRWASRLAFGVLALPMLLGLPDTVRFFRADNLRRMDPFLRTGAQSPERKLVFLRDVPEFDPSWYARNEPDLSGTIFARDRGPLENAKLALALPGLPHFTYLREREGFRLLAHPK